MKRKQLGIGFIGLFFSLVLLAVATTLVLKVIPAVNEYFTIKKHVKTLSVGAADRPTKDIEDSFDKYAAVDGIRAIQGKDLEITKGRGSTRIGFNYEKRIVLGGNVSLLIHFKHSVLGN